MVATNGRSARQRQAERYSIGAVENALVLLRAIAERDVLGLGEAAEIAGVSKSTAYRLLATLEVAGLAERLPESGYRAGVEAMRWAIAPARRAGRADGGPAGPEAPPG